MTPDEQKAKAMAFRRMHREPKILVLPNVWDVISARLFEDAGFAAIATTSAGVAFSLGYPDGEKISREEMVARVGRIARAVKVPVTADMEAGYGPRPEDAARTVREVIEAGAVGMNLEDGTRSGDTRGLAELSLQVEKIHAVREAALKTGVLLVLNARTDVYLVKAGDPGKWYDEAVRRLAAYREAGADCGFLIGVMDAETIGRAVQDVKFPLNILAAPGSPAIPELEKLGVARVTFGSGPMRATLGLLRKIAGELKSAGTYTTLAGGIPGMEAQELASSR